MPTVSIILPAYNEEKEIMSAISEVDKQTFKDREIIIVDDGSVDSTREIVAKYCESHPDARLIASEHGGLTHARNVGIRESNSRIIFFAESDCVYDADYVEKAVSCLEKNPDANAVCLTGAPLIIRSTLATECIEIENVMQHKLLSLGKIKPFYAWVFRKRTLLELGGFDEQLFQGEDKDIFRRFVNAGNKVAWLPGVHWKHKRDQTTWELTKKWYKRARSRIIFVMKHRLKYDLAKTLLPFWTLVFGVILTLALPAADRIFGAILILLVLSLFIVKCARVAKLVWDSLPRKRYLLGYSLFLMARNFSSALGYTCGLLFPLRNPYVESRVDDGNAQKKAISSEQFSLPDEFEE